MSMYVPTKAVTGLYQSFWYFINKFSFAKLPTWPSIYDQNLQKKDLKEVHVLLFSKWMIPRRSRPGTDRKNQCGSKTWAPDRQPHHSKFFSIKLGRSSLTVLLQSITADNVRASSTTVSPTASSTTGKTVVEDAVGDTVVEDAVGETVVEDAVGETVVEQKGSLTEIVTRSMFPKKKKQ